MYCLLLFHVVIWTAQGSYLAMCSDENTMSRNSGVFWAILQSRYEQSKLEKSQTGRDISTLTRHPKY